MAVSDANVDTTPQQPRHEWLHIRVGRVCQKCHVVQTTDEFDDDAPCGDLPGDRHRRRPQPSAG
jgi:hypothetical protein